MCKCFPISCIISFVSHSLYSLYFSLWACKLGQLHNKALKAKLPVEMESQSRPRYEKRKEEWEQADNKQRYSEEGYLSKKKYFSTVKLFNSQVSEASAHCSLRTKTRALCIASFSWKSISD